MKKLEINYYNSCKNLPIENFYELLNTHDFRWILIDHKSGDEYSDIDDKLLEDTWKNIHSEYIELIEDKSGNKDYIIIAQLVEMEEEINIVSTLLDFHIKVKSKSIKNEIEQWGYYPNDLSRSLKKLQSLKFRISIFRSKNEDLFKKQEEDVDKIEYDLYSDVVLLEQSLGDGLLIDVKKTVVSKWVRYVKISEKKYKDIKKDGK